MVGRVYRVKHRVRAGLDQRADTNARIGFLECGAVGSQRNEAIGAGKLAQFLAAAFRHKPIAPGVADELRRATRQNQRKILQHGAPTGQRITATGERLLIVPGSLRIRRRHALDELPAQPSADLRVFLDPRRGAGVEVHRIGDSDAADAAASTDRIRGRCPVR